MVATVGEADDSIDTPASRASYFALKCTPQMIRSGGVLLTAPTSESPGGMAKEVMSGGSHLGTPLQLPREVPTT